MNPACAFDAPKGSYVPVKFAFSPQQWYGPGRTCQKCGGKGVEQSKSRGELLYELRQVRRPTEVEDLLTQLQPRTAKDYSFGIAAFGRTRDWSRALSLLNQMRRKHVMLDVITFSNAITACQNSGKWEQALWLINEMCTLGLKPDLIIYNKAISACEKGGQFQRAAGLLQQIRTSGLKPDKFSFSTAISSCKKSRDWREALRLVQEMRSDAVMTDVFPLNAAISACGNAMQWQHALSVFNGIHDVGLNPDRVSFAAAISACEKSGQWQQAMLLLSKMDSAGCSRELYSLNAAISAYEKGGQWQRALSLLNEVSDSSVSPNVISYGAAISACEKGDQWQRAILLIEKMRQAGVTPNVWAFNAALCACDKKGQWEETLQLFGKVHAAGLIPDEFTYSSAISANVQACEWQQALSLFEEMCVMGEEPNLLTIGFAVSACRQGQIWDSVLSVLQEMRLEGLTPSVISLCAAIVASQGKGEWQRTFSLMEKNKQFEKGLEIMQYPTPKPKAQELPQFELAKRILYEDADVVVINKPSNCRLHPDGPVDDGTLVNALACYLQKSGGNLDWAYRGRKAEWPGVVHRLDKDTTGCIVMAKNAVAHAILSRAFTERKTRKQYICVSSGKPASSHMDVETLIGEHPMKPTVMTAMPLDVGNELSGKIAEHRIAKSTVHMLGWDEKFSLLRIAIHTGRTHQIRVHMQHLQTPIVGDRLYGLEDCNFIAKKYHGISRPLLHALCLSFPHPMYLNKTISVQAPIPADFHMIAGHILEGLSEQALA